MSLFFVISAAAEQSVTLAWDPNSEPDLAGYVLYYGTNSGDYRTSIQVGNVTLVTVTGLTETVTYYFAVTAVNQFGAESGFSNEVGYTVPSCRGGPADVAPRGKGGDGKVDLVDWVQVGLFCMGLEVSSNRCERGKADCWPKGRGDGVIDLCDWVQAGLYAAHLDSAGGGAKAVSASASSFAPSSGKPLLSVSCAVIALENFLSLHHRESQKHIPREQRLLERDRFPPILVSRIVARQGTQETLARAILHQFFLAPRARMRHPPWQIARGKDIANLSFVRKYHSSFKFLS